MVDLAPINTLLVSLARTSAALEISRTTYVPPPEGGAEGAPANPSPAQPRAPSAGLLADLAETDTPDQADRSDAARSASGSQPASIRPSRGGLEMLVAEQSPLEPELIPSRSLLGLRPAQAANPPSTPNPSAEPQDADQAADTGTSKAAIPAQMRGIRSDGPVAEIRTLTGTDSTPTPTSAGSAVPSTPPPAVGEPRDAPFGEARGGNGTAAGGVTAGGAAPPSRDGQVAADARGDAVPEASTPFTRTTSPAPGAGAAAGTAFAGGSLTGSAEDGTRHPDTVAVAAEVRRPQEAEPPLRPRRTESGTSYLRPTAETAVSETAVSKTAWSALRDDAVPSPATGIAATDGWSMPADAALGQQVERGGIIASFILNAAMIPGWPPPRPFAVPGQEELFGTLGRVTALPNEAEFFAFLKQRGTKPTLLARLRQLLARLSKSRRLRVMLGLAALSSAIESVLDAVEEELTRLNQSDRDEDEAAEAEAIQRRLSV